MEADHSGHVPVLLKEVVEGLAIEPDGFVVDCTFGRGGHSRAILARLSPEGRLLGLDRDADAINSDAAREMGLDPRFELVQASFSDLRSQVLERRGVGSVSSVLLDVGVSSPQLDDSERGFSFMRSGPLDMRMNKSEALTAAQWLSSVAEHKLYEVLRDYGEERFARRIAVAITKVRDSRPIETTGQLAQVIADAVPFREKGKHPATRSFQAIRIFVNNELKELELVLSQAVEVLKPGGRLAVISFHSLEDRIVKRFMRDEERGGCVINSRVAMAAAEKGKIKRIGKAIMPSSEESKRNPRARSAVLRIAEKGSE